MFIKQCTEQADVLHTAEDMNMYLNFSGITCRLSSLVVSKNNPIHHSRVILIFTVAPCILILSSLFIYPTDAQLDCSKIMSKFTLKSSYMFRFNNCHQGATIRTLLKLQSLK